MRVIILVGEAFFRVKIGYHCLLVMIAYIVYARICSAALVDDAEVNIFILCAAGMAEVGVIFPSAVDAVQNEDMPCRCTWGSVSASVKHGMSVCQFLIKHFYPFGSGVIAAVAVA